MLPVLFGSIFLPVILAYPDINVEILNKMSTPQGYEQFMKTQLSLKGNLISEECALDMYRYISDLLKGKLWAIQMFDSGAKIPSGLLRGHGAALGTFDECLNIKSEISITSKTIRGKYCQGSFLLANLTEVDFNSLGEFPKHRILNFKEATIHLPWGACVPSSCTAKDIETLHLFIFRFSEETCQTEDNLIREFDNGDKAAMAIVGVIICLVILSTSYDVVLYYHSKGENGSDLLRSFSVITNASNILTIKNEDKHLGALHGMRVFSLLTLMGGMRYLLFVLSPLHNWIDITMWVLDRNSSIILETMVCIDTFLVISGFLISYKYLKSRRNGVAFNILKYYLRRIVRLTPSLAVVILLHATLLRHIGAGPVWPKIRDQWLVDNCREYWWSAMLYVQNYVNPKLYGICILQTWHLSVDMQLFIVSPLILLPLKRWPKYTTKFLGFLFICAITSQFLTGWIYNIKAVLVMQRSLKDIEHYFQHFFFPTHTRATPWIVGILLGYYVFQTEINEKRPFKNTGKSKLLIVLLWTISIFFLLFNIFIGRVYIEEAYNWLTHSVLLAFIRPLWSLGVAGIIFACATGYGGPVNQLLSSAPCIVVSKISYSIFLTYWSIMFIFTFQTRLGREFSHLDAMHSIFADIMISVLLGFVWSLFFELPLVAVTRILLGKPRGQ